MQWKKRWNKGWHIHGAPGGGYSIGSRLALYWLCLVLAALAAALFLAERDGVLSRTARQFGETAALQQKNTAAVFISQMDILTAQGHRAFRSGQRGDGALPRLPQPLL